MEIIIAKRQGGKTTRAIEIAKATGAYLVVPNLEMAHLTHRKYDGSFRLPVTFDELISTGMEKSRVRNIIIDNADLFLEHLFPRLKIDAISVTGVRRDDRPEIYHPFTT